MFTDFRFELASTRHEKLLAEAAARRIGRAAANPRTDAAPEPPLLVARILRRFAGPVGI